MESEEAAECIIESTIHGQELNPKTQVFETEIPQTKETDTLISGATKPTGIRLTSWFWNSYVCNSLATTLFLSAGNCMIKILSEKYSMFLIVVLRSVIIIGVLVPVSYAQHLPLFGPPSKYKLLVARGVFGGCGYITICLSTFLLPISESAFLTNIFPAVTAFISWVLALEKLNWISWTGIVGTILGNALIAHPPFMFGGHEDWGLTRVLGIAIALLSNLFSSASYFLSGKIGTSVSTTTVSLYQIMGSLIISLCLMAICPYKLRSSFNRVEGTLLLGVTLSSLFYQVTVNRALQIGPQTKTVMIIMMNMVWTAAFGVLVLSEKMTWASVTGSCIILVSVMSVISQKHNLSE